MDWSLLLPFGIGIFFVVMVVLFLKDLLETKNKIRDSVDNLKEIKERIEKINNDLEEITTKIQEVQNR